MSSIQYFVDRVNKKHPFTFVDIGAMGGIPKKWDILRGALKVIAFEPDEREFHKLTSTEGTAYFNFALNRKSEGLRYYVTRGHGNSSIYRPNQEVLSQFADSERFSVAKEEYLPSGRVKDLDSLAQENSISDIDFIKLDTQGSELPILEGCQKNVLPKTFGMNIEVEFAELYEGQPLFRHVDEFMDKNGFQLMDLRRAYWKRKDYYDFIGKGQLVFGDALYFKKINILSRELSALQDQSFAASKIFKCILSCLVYRLFDYAVAVTGIGERLKLFSDAESKGTIGEIKRYSKMGSIPHFPGRTLLYKAINRIGRTLRPPSYLGWADGDDTIGNIKDR